MCVIDDLGPGRLDAIPNLVVWLRIRFRSKAATLFPSLSRVSHTSRHSNWGRSNTLVGALARLEIWGGRNKDCPNGRRHKTRRDMGQMKKSGEYLSHSHTQLTIPQDRSRLARFHFELDLDSTACHILDLVHAKNAQNRNSRTRARARPKHRIVIDRVAEAILEAIVHLRVYAAALSKRTRTATVRSRLRQLKPSLSRLRTHRLITQTPQTNRHPYNNLARRRLSRQPLTLFFSAPVS